MKKEKKLSLSISCGGNRSLIKGLLGAGVLLGVEKVAQG